ncbi:MAG TPA: FAD-dependent oxidoreductase [Ktedonobacteraceae bacterium]
MSKQNTVGTVDQADIVIVGNGIAGLTAAVEARRLEPDKSVVIVTSQSHPTINTPALKQFAIGKLTREQLLAYPAGTERQQCIHIVNAYAEEIRAQEGYVRLSDGQGFGYGALLLATGSRPTGLPTDMPGQDFDGVLTLHRLYDYLDLRRRLNEVEEAVVIGGGPHAVETVMGLLYWGIKVHWLIRSETFMPRMLDRQASDMILEGTRRAGAKVYTETETLGIVGRVGSVAGVVTTRQQMLPCQLVLVCTGTMPVNTLARNCDLPMKYDRGGILVDDQLRTSARNIYAAGDVAALRDPLTGKYAPRPQWHAAVLQGRAAAAAMTGAAELEDFGVPWHATRLGDLSMLTVGNPLAWQESVTPLTEKRKGSYCLLSLVDDRLVGYLSLGSAQPDSLAIKRIIDEGLSVREITRDLLRGEFDARKYFSGKRTYAAQRMLTTGQLPTPLPPMPGIMTGERRSGQRLPSPKTANAPSPLVARTESQKDDTAVRLKALSATQRGDTSARMNAVPPTMPAATTRREDTAARMNAVPPTMPAAAIQRGDTAIRMNAVPPTMPAAATQRGDTSGSMSALNTRTQGMAAQHGDTAARLNAVPPTISGKTARPMDTAIRVNTAAPRERYARPEESEAWVNAPPPVTPQGSTDIGWMNATPSSTSRPRAPEIPARNTEDLQRPATEPLVRPTQTGSRSVTGPRPPVRQMDERRRRIAEQKTLVNPEARLAPGGQAGKPQQASKPKEAEREQMSRAPDRQFIAPPGMQPQGKPGEENNPHPSRSLWHYTDKHPAVKGKKHV